MNRADKYRHFDLTTASSAEIDGYIEDAAKAYRASGIPAMQRQEMVDYLWRAKSAELLRRERARADAAEQRAELERRRKERVIDFEKTEVHRKGAWLWHFTQEHKKAGTDEHWLKAWLRIPGQGWPSSEQPTIYYVGEDEPAAAVVEEPEPEPDTPLVEHLKSQGYEIS
jgi:hypothetical protein